MDYDKAIADAAREYVAAKHEARLSGNGEEASIAYNKLVWMVDAKKYGWNPADYQPGG